MFEKLLSQINNWRIVRTFQFSTTPRWIILLIDMLIVTASFSIVEIGAMYTLHRLASPAMLLMDWAIVATVYFLIIYLSKIHNCVIRLSVIVDLYRTFMAAFTATVILFVINLVCFLVSHEYVFSFWNLFFIGVLSFTIMMVERLFIKYFYMRLTANNNSNGRRRVLVLGTSLSSLILANALKNESGGQYDPVGLLSIKTGKESDQINGFDVFRFDPTSLADVFVGRGIYALIFNAKHTELMRNGFADYFIKNNIALLSINTVEEFDTETDDDEKNMSQHVREVQIEDLLGREPIVLNNTLVRNNISGSCVLITGACGSIGSEIVRQVATYKARKIILVDQAETPMHDLSIEMKKKFPDADIVLFMADVQNKGRLEVAFRNYRPRFVFHAAAYKHVPMMEINPTEAVLTNVAGTRNVADLAVQYGVYKFVMVSTDKAVNPTNIMGCTKRLAEIYCQSMYLNNVKRDPQCTQFITTRFGNVLGSNGSVIPLFRKQIEEGGPVTVTHKDIIRYFMTIPEACSLVLEAGCMGHGGEIYIFDMGEPVKIYDLARRMISLAGLRPDIDIKIEEVGLRPGEKLYEELLNDKEKTTATVNKKIMVAKVRVYDYKNVCEALQQMGDYARKGDERAMVYAMKQFVPEFKSNQSRFEEIDREIEAGMNNK